MLGGVVLTQGKNVLRGDRLMVDMTTGVSRVESDSGRVQGLFQSSGQGGPAIPGSIRLRRSPTPASGRHQINRNNINSLIRIAAREVEARGVSLYLRRTQAVREPYRQTADTLADHALARDPPQDGVFRWARDIHSFMLRERESNRRGGSRNHRERLSEAGMVDLLGMFRRRPAKRSPPGFARSRADITALGDSMGEMLTSPVRDAPPLARDAPLPTAGIRREPKSRVAPPNSQVPQAEDQAAARGAAADAAGGLSGCA